MAAISDDRIVERLQQALVALEAERDDELERVRDAYTRRIISIQQALTAFDTSVIIAPNNGESTFAKSAPKKPPVQTQDRPTEVVLAVSQERMDMVDRYLQRFGRARQADIAADLDFNSGTVSVALRRLEQEHKARPLDKLHGSQVWEYLHVPALSKR
jgi:hypothetical protein